jgi:hypothetical protein
LHALKDTDTGSLKALLLLFPESLPLWWAALIVNIGLSDRPLVSRAAAC